MGYDRMDVHYNENLPAENGGTHIGMFLTWIIQNNLIGEFHLENSPDGLTKVHNKEWTGRDFLINECDGKFWEEDLNEEGNEFAEYYYYDFTSDYYKAFEVTDSSVYTVENSWENYEKIKPILDKRYLEWKTSKA